MRSASSSSLAFNGPTRICRSACILRAPHTIPTLSRDFAANFRPEAREFRALRAASACRARRLSHRVPKNSFYNVSLPDAHKHAPPTLVHRVPVDVVLVSPRNPLNIGAVARAMANFGFRLLTVVAPFEPHWREAQSAVGAEDLLGSARVREHTGRGYCLCNPRLWHRHARTPQARATGRRAARARAYRLRRDSPAALA